MGVPKFFRYISERYPCLSEFVKEYQIPEFDNLYLDMNGIIHMCSHPDDNNPHFRITEEKIFADIFHYIEVLFQLIKPQKVFFMAVDGVAPRAKMNQQRGRRFRSAKDAEKLEREALKKGEKLPEGDRFDSNCITPGTPFMARLQEQLKYFVVKKISTDKLWKKCRIILSGHETPGEGEHKIMDYIRYSRSRPGYDPNTRHCLYGLDADLIMLGLCTHDPHFSLLREEVKFGKKAKRSNVPEEIRFYLLHLSLMREYLELEFASLKKQLEGSQLEFDIEKIIDDWILMGFLVGNDFIPNLPNLHITNGALPVLYKAYSEVLPTLDGYINEAGTLNLDRFEKFMKKLSEIDVKNFEEAQDDLLYMAIKTGRKQNFHTAVHSKHPIEDTFGTNGCIEYTKDPGLADLIAATDELDVSSDDESDKMSSSNEDEAFKSYKDEYYRNKLEYQKVTPEVMREQAEGYVRAIQWNLNYYYNGVCSWSWFYPHHYSPYISDIKGFSNLKIEFDLGKPFKPYEQLLAVLPTASKNLLPKCYHHLMTDDASDIKSYYPEDFQTDLNGKRQEWEAVVLVPFIDEEVLLSAMQPCNELLDEEEARRNQHGPMLVYEYTEEDLGTFEAPGYFPDVRSHARCTPVSMEEIRVPREELVKGAYPGALFDVFYPGFPTMKHLRYEGDLRKARVKVFEVPSRNENMMLRILPSGVDFNETIPLDLLGRTVWVGWPHLVEAKVVALSTRKEKCVFSKSEKKGYKVEDKVLFENELEGVTQRYKERMGIEFGKTDVLVHVKQMIGRKYVFTSGRRVTLEKQFHNLTSNYPLQSIVTNIKAHDDCQSAYMDVSDVFSEGSVCFSLSQPHYGAQGTIMNSTESLQNNYLTVSLSLAQEPDLRPARKVDERLKTSYLSLSNAASQLRLSNYVFSRVTGSLFLSATRNGEGGFKSVNIGLDLKFNKKNQETPGYTRKVEHTWMYTSRAVDLVNSYLEKFPEVFDYLTRSTGDDIQASEIFKVGSDEKVKSVQTWLKTLPTYNLERRVCGSLVLEPEVVAEIEKIVDGIQEAPKEIAIQIKPHMLYKPGIQTGNLPPDPLAVTKVFDRIVNIREDSPIPLGLKGTVISIHKSTNTVENEAEMYDVLFDRPFPGGLALNCAQPRGYRLSRVSFINLTHGKRQMEQQTGAPGSLRTLAKDRNPANYAGGGFSSSGSPRKSSNSAFASFNKIPPNFLANPPAQQGGGRGAAPHGAGQYQQRHHQNSVQEAPKVKGSFHFLPDHAQSYDPRLNKENSHNKRNVPVSVQSHQDVSKRPPNLNQRPVPTQPRMEVNTDFLKRILNIPSTNANSVRSSVQQQGEPTRQQQRIFSRPQEVPNSTSATARLLSFYQSNLWGCPRYTYLEEDKGFCAQLVLPDAQIIDGRIARSREEASESVAAEALRMLQSRSSKEGLPSQFPVPPTKWVQDWRQPQNPLLSQVYVNRAHQVRPNQRPDYNRREPEPDVTRGEDDLQRSSRLGPNANAPSFVPLQALKKRQGNKTVNTVNRTHNSDTAQCTKTEKNSAPKSTAHNASDASKGHGSGSSKERNERSGRHRKTRIAANFNK